VDEGERDAAFSEVRKHRLAQVPLVPGAVQQVVDDLKGDPHRTADRGQPGFVFVGGVPEHGSDAGGRREQRGRFHVDDLHVLGLGDFQVPGPGILGQFALDHPGGQVGQDPDDAIVPRPKGQADGFDEEVIPDQDRDVGAPLDVRRNRPPARSGVVDDVVVNEAGGVDHFDERREGGVFRTRVAGDFRGEKEKRRPQAFPPVLEDGAADVGDERIRGARPFPDVPFDGVQAGADPGVDFIEVRAAGSGGSAVVRGAGRIHRKLTNCIWMPRSLALRAAMIS